MITERFNINATLMQQVKYMNSTDLVKLCNRLYIELAKKLTEDEQATLAVLLEVEHELVNRELI